MGAHFGADNGVPMTRIPTLLITLSLATLSWGALFAAPATSQGGPPDCLPTQVLENDDVRIWFQGLKGHLKVFDKDNNTTTLVYDYQTVQVKELGDDNATLANFKMDRAFPQDSTCTIEENDEFVNITFTITKDVKRGTSQGQSVGEATVDVIWHWNKSAEGIKFDLFVHDWPWQSNESELAFDFNVVSGYEIESAENGLGFRNETDSKGYIEWAPNATAYYEDGHNETAIVESETTLGGENNNTADVTLRFTNATAGYNELEYDPWVGVGDYIIVLNRLIGLGVVRQVLPEPLRFVYDDLVSPTI